MNGDVSTWYTGMVQIVKSTHCVAYLIGVQIPPMLVHHVQLCGSERLGCSATCQEVSRCHTTGESEESIACS